MNNWRNYLVIFITIIPLVFMGCGDDDDDAGLDNNGVQGNLDAAFANNGIFTFDSLNPLAKAKEEYLRTHPPISPAQMKQKQRQQREKFLSRLQNTQLATHIQKRLIERYDRARADGDDIGKAIAVSDDNTEIFLAGNVDVAGDNNIAIIKLDVNGNLDAAFGTNGVVIQDIIDTNDNLTAIAFFDDANRVDSLAITVTSGIDTALAKFNADDGNLDTAFDGDGIANFANNTFNDLEIDDNNDIVAVGRNFNGAGSDAIFANINGDDGTTDNTFSGDGFAEVGNGNADFFEFNKVLIDGDGNIIASGGISEGGGDLDSMIAKIDDTGNLVNGFGNAGVVEQDFVNGVDDFFNGLAEDEATGNLFAGGEDLNGDGFIAAFDSNGGVVSGFDGDGVLNVDSTTINDVDFDNNQLGFVGDASGVGVTGFTNQNGANLSTINDIGVGELNEISFNNFGSGNRALVVGEQNNATTDIVGALFQ